VDNNADIKGLRLFTLVQSQLLKEQTTNTHQHFRSQVNSCGSCKNSQIAHGSAWEYLLVRYMLESCSNAQTTWQVF